LPTPAIASTSKKFLCETPTHRPFPDLEEDDDDDETDDYDKFAEEDVE